MEQQSETAALGFAEFLPTTAGYDLSGEERAQLAEFTRAHDDLTAYVLEHVTKADPEDLDERLDLILEDDQYQTYRHDVSRLLPWSVLKGVLHRNPSLTFDVPSIVASDVALAVRIEHASTTLTVKAMSKMPMAQTERTPAPSKDPTGTHRWLLEANVPAPARTSMIAHRFGEICAYALLSGKITSPVLAVELAEKWLHGVSSSYALIASILREPVDPALVPSSYLVDIATMSREYEESRMGLAIALNKVETTGKGFPEVFLAKDEDR